MKKNIKTSPNNPRRHKLLVAAIMAVLVATSLPSVHANAKAKKHINMGEFTLTAYCSCEECNDEWCGYPTASGTDYKEGRTVAVDPDVISLGSKLLIDGKEYIAEDTGGAIKGDKIDIYLDSHEATEEFGVQFADVKIIR